MWFSSRLVEKICPLGKMKVDRQMDDRQQTTDDQKSSCLTWPPSASSLIELKLV